MWIFIEKHFDLMLRILCLFLEWSVNKIHVLLVNLDCNRNKIYYPMNLNINQRFGKSSDLIHYEFYGFQDEEFSFADILY